MSLTDQQKISRAFSSAGVTDHDLMSVIDDDDALAALGPSLLGLASELEHPGRRNSTVRVAWYAPIPPQDFVAQIRLELVKAETLGPSSIIPVLCQGLAKKMSLSAYGDSVDLLETLDDKVCRFFLLEGLARIKARRSETVQLVGVELTRPDPVPDLVLLAGRLKSPDFAPRLQDLFDHPTPRVATAAKKAMAKLRSAKVPAAFGRGWYVTERQSDQEDVAFSVALAYVPLLIDAVLGKGNDCHGLTDALRALDDGETLQVAVSSFDGLLQATRDDLESLELRFIGSDEYLERAEAAVAESGALYDEDNGR